jgi:signal transduction histidine kinase
MSKSGSREAAFIGKITASATHEIRNVLAIVKESAGLIDDLMQAAVTRGPLDGDRVLKATNRIDVQVARGADIITGLNRFAHSLDHDHQGIDLDEEVRQVVFLTQRFARRKNQKVVALPGAGTPAFSANSLTVQMALFAALELCMEELPEGATFEVRAGATGTRPGAELTARMEDMVIPPPTVGPAWDRQRALVQELGAALDVTGSKLILLFGSV